MSGRRGEGPDSLGEQFESVLAGASSGAGWAAERLWRSLAPSVAGYVRAQGAADPDDLTSEVFLGVFRGLGTFSGDEQQFRSWVFTIAHRRLVDDRRRASRRPHLVGIDGHPEVPDSVPGADQEALRRASAERVQRLCERLAPDQRDVLLLRLVAGLTVEEVAASLGKSPGAVKALQRRALVAVRKLIEREGVPL